MTGPLSQMTEPGLDPPPPSRCVREWPNSAPGHSETPDSVNRPYPKAALSWQALYSSALKFPT